ncbi:Transcriptional regulator, PadR family [Rhodovulum sp. PH10]|uniref:PadR family transcriptional regulator n=1 Tax=Rhodovulum sp. PH10 TaxID=1187851 RepID=UPI00027C1DF3|nr:PadR family transcriptional regulator [Rhodovulum sp. PH10]EJW12474.1 Transcriptional regulator, PadR family [Rhodovulum sp. PH10]
MFGRFHGLPDERGGRHGRGGGCGPAGGPPFGGRGFFGAGRFGGGPQGGPEGGPEGGRQFGGRGAFGGGFFGGGRFGDGPEGGHRGMRGGHGGPFGRLGRMLGQGDLRLLALALIAEQPRHGYEIIKLFEEKTEGWYAPSPGMVYPTLTYLEEVGHVTGQTEGSRKLYTITDEGRAHLADNRELVEAMMARLAAVGEKAKAWRRRAEGDQGPSVSRLVDAAIANLRDVAAERFRADPAAEPQIVEVLANAASQLRRPDQQ